MKIELHEITIEEIAKNYTDNAEKGVSGYDGKLNIRPTYQREFVYDVIKTKDKIMAKNASLRRADKAKQDEFYTRSFDIENELKHYKKHFDNKIVFCNCDDPYESNFFKYFAINFNYLHLKKLIATYKVANPKHHPYKIEITEVQDYNKDGAVDLVDVDYLLKNKKNVMTLLKGNGDFRSDECIELLKQADIVVTNPPFSLFREYIAQLMKYDKKFVIIGNMNAITYKEFFPLLKENKVWCGYSFNKTCEFIAPSNYELKGKAFIDNNGKMHCFVPAICWYTNLNIPKRHDNLVDNLYKKYNPTEYPKYDNYDAINVNKVTEIPLDYYDYMGVPITFLDKYNPDEFEIIDGIGRYSILNNEKTKKEKMYLSMINNKAVYFRIIIRRKKQGLNIIKVSK